MRKFIQVSLTITVQAFAGNVAILGGIDLTGAPPYGALVSSSGEMTPLPLGDVMTITGMIQSVSMNSSGIGLIGGYQHDSITGFTPAYAAFVSPTGVVTPISITGLPAMHGIINSVAINNSGNGIIGGRDTTGPIYAALVSSSGNSITPLTFPPVVGLGGIVNSVAINESGNCLIGGKTLSGSQPAYAATVSSTGVMTPLSLPGGIATAGQINSVAINYFGKGLIGGRDQTGSQPAYVAFVFSDTVDPLTLTGGIATAGQITSVSINGFGNGIIGGQDLTGFQPAYAALVSSSGALAPLTLTGGMTTNGIINSVAINESGNAIIGGQDLTGSQPAYAALVSSSGTVTPLELGSHLATNGNIFSVAINEDGNGIIGGQDLTGSQPAYAALFTSSGTVIPLAFTGGMATNGWINSVAWMQTSIFTRIPTASLTGNNLIFANYINEFASENAFYFIPSELDGTLNAALQSAAPTRNGISIYTASNNLFFLSMGFANHIRNQQTEQLSNSITVADNGVPYDELLTSLCLPKTANSSDNPFSIWFQAIGAWAHQKSQDQTVGFDPATGGVVLACDRLITPKLRIGGGASYLFTHIHEKEGQGHVDLNQEEAFIYSSWDNQKFYFDLLVMGGAVQIDQVRKTKMTSFSFHSSSDPNGWQLLSHLELGFKANLFNRCKTSRFYINPFAMLDWANAWQESFKEKGDSPFNAAQKSQYGSLLRTETGLRFYQILFFDSWNFSIQEKISYVNTQSFNSGRINAFLVGSPGSFTVETLSSAQNLGLAQLAMSFDPENASYPKTTFFYQGEFGERYYSNQFNIELAWQF
ncbi:MAG: autotransporter domain-containing protein [Parachlamydiales bacterium]|nr:autotransporter domain-containing protein [Parachlamydiales bacterium]